MTKWDAQNSILDTDIPMQVHNDAVSELNIIDLGENTYYLTLRLNWNKNLLHVATVRDRDEPRMFKHLDRLVSHIRIYYKYYNTIQLIFQPTDKKFKRRN